MMLRIKFKRKWWDKYAEDFREDTNDEIRSHLEDWTSFSFGRIKPTETDKFGALLLYNVKNKASKKRIR